MAWEQDGSWYIQIERAGIVKKLRFSTEQDAENAEILRRHSSARDFARNTKTHQSIVSLIERAQKDGRLMESANLKRTIDAMGAWAIKPGLTVQGIAECLEYWKTTRDFAYSTRFLYVKILKRVLRIIGYYDPFFENLRQALPHMQQPGNRVVTVTDGDFDLVFQAAPLGYKFILLVTRGAGLRLSEAMSIRPRMINFSNGLASFVQKGPSERSQKFAERILEMAKLCRDPNLRCCDQLMKPLHGAPRFIRQEALRQYLKRTIVKFDLPRFCFHDLRRSMATEIHRKTRDLFLLKEFLGHRSIASTIAYVKPFAPQEISSIIEDCQPKLSDWKIA